MAKKTPKNIPVSFAWYEPYENWPERIHLGKIDYNTADQLMNEIGRAGPKRKSNCFARVCAEMSRTARCGHTIGGDRQYTNLDLNGMFYFYDPVDSIIPCMVNTRRMPQDETAMLRACAFRLRTGKCCDPFVRRLIGEKLFPQHYAKTK